VEWLSPLADDDYAEYSDGAFLGRLRCADLKVPLETFWPRGGPEWDGLARTSDNQLVIIEAKAHIPEIVSTPTAATEPALSSIQQSLAATKTFMGCSAPCDWATAFYQYTNRLAHLYFLRELNQLPAYLVFLYFTHASDAGRSGPQLYEFDKFAASLRTVWPLITRLQEALPPQLVDKHWADLAAVFSGIDAMASRTSLVGTSKVMAHALPRLVAPVDRRYTMRFLFGSEQIRDDKPTEWATLRRCLQDFFYPVAASPKFIAKAEAWMKQSGAFRWDTSPLKVVDNLLVGFQQARPAHGGPGFRMN